MINQKHQWTKGRILNGAIALLLMVMIFLFSAGNGDDSSELSTKVTEWLMGLIYPEYATLSAGKQAGAFALLHLLVRKAAHFGEFALLGAALRQFLWTFPIRWPGLPAWLAATLYAALDGSARILEFQDVAIGLSAAE